MATVKTLAEKLRDLRIKYQEQTSNTEKRYEEALARNKERTAKIKKADYASKYSERYRALAEANNSVFSQIKQIEEKTHGLKFKASDYLKTVRAESFSPSQVETFFEELTKRCVDCAKELAKDKPFSEYEKDLKIFCGLYVTAQYISDNSDKILAESGIPESERAADLSACAQELKEIKEKRGKDTALEALPCYDEMVALINEVKSSSSKIKEDMLGSGKFYFNKEYKYLMGFWKEKIADEDVEFAQNVLGLSPSELSSQPIYFSPQDGLCNIVINLHNEDFTHPVYVSFVRNLYFAIMSRLPKNTMRFSSIACETISSDNVVLLVNTIAENLGSPKNYIKDNVGETGRVLQLLQSLKDGEDGLLKTIPAVNRSGEKSLFALNLKAEQSRKAFNFLRVDNYPSGFTNGTATSSEVLRQLMRKSAGMGFFTVVSQNVDAEYTDKYAKFTDSEKDLNAMFIDMTDPKHVKINGREAVLDVALPTFDDIDFLKALKDYYETAETFFIDKMFDEVDLHRKEVLGNKPEKIAVPLGYAGKSLFTFNFDLDSACHTFILGASGSGKTSFLHTFILSTCYNHSPDDVNFYIADYKGGEFDIYARENVKRLPHIKYYLAKNKQENKIVTDWIDMLQMINRIMKYRNSKLFPTVGANDILTYRERSGKKLPYIIVILDEYQAMLEDVVKAKRTSEKSTFCSQVESLLSQARSAGIVIIFGGQQTEMDISLSLVPNRLILSNDTGAIKSLCYDGKSDFKDKIDGDGSYLAVEKEGRAVFGKNLRTETTRFRAAFSGKGDAKLHVIERVWVKYKDYKAEPLIIGGTVEPFYISQPTVPSYDSMTEPVMRDDVSGKEGDFGYDPYDREAYPLYVGVTATDTYPSALSFSTSKTSCGYMMHTKMSLRLNMFMCSAIMSFLYKTAKMDCEYEGERVHFFAQKNEFDRDLGSFIKDMPAVSKNVRHHETKFDLYNSLSALVELKELFDYRDRTYAPDGGWTPIFVVIHDVDWILRDDLEMIIAEGFAKEKAEEKERTEKPKKLEFSEADIAKAMEDLRFLYARRRPPVSDEWLRAEAIKVLTTANAEKGQNAGKETKKGSRGFSSADVKNAIKKLYMDGNTCGIFVLIGSEKRDELYTFKNDYVNKESASLNTVFGSYSEMERELDMRVDADTSKEIKDEANICYVNPGNVRTRIYQFNKLGDAKWLNNLENLLSRRIK